MKKILLILSIFIMPSIIMSVKAETLTLEETGLYYTRYNSSTDSKLSDAYYFYRIDGEVSYCIEPGIPEGSNDYTQGDWLDTNIPLATREKINLIAYYGYTYPGHQTKEYRTATQALIWEEILPTGSWYHFNSYYWEWGEDFNITNEKNTILSLVENHHRKPMIEVNNEFYIGDEIVLEDKNSVLGDFDIDIENMTKDDYEVVDNKIIVHPREKGKITIKMIKKQVYDVNYKIFISNEHQDMYTAGNIDDVIYTKEINVLPLTSISLKKQANKESSMSLLGAVYNVYREDGEYILNLITDENGHAETEKILKKGKYYLKEIKAPKGYELDLEEYHFTVDGMSENITINAVDNVIESELIIFKETYNEGSSPQIEEGVVFNIFDENDLLYTTITTDNKGYAKTSLVYGTYIIKQQNTKEGYMKVDDIIVTIDESSDKELFFSLIDEEIREYVKIIKVDNNGKPIENNSAKFSIYDIDNNKTLCLTLNDTNICEYSTDASGELLIPFKVPYGHYMLIEKEAPIGYKKADNLRFDIDGEKRVVTLYVINDLIEKELRIKKTNDNGETLENVSFAIYSDNDELISIKKTDKNGEIQIVLPFGKYYFQEYITLDNYELDAKKYYFNIDASDEELNFVIINVPKTGKNKNLISYISPITIGLILCIKRLRDFFI